ncbi:hypothetical protein [Sphingomonas sp. ERG5]|uniref:hypothetical protein n=1 Tax=Sphingomonas sp. ERG5 TaxID=1381597 RepID=UPI00054BD629|nr:hypothetical protein [Sphingomonas sp. ERG5]
MGRPIVLISPLDPVALAKKLKRALGGRDGQAKVAGVTGQGTERDMTLFYYRPNARTNFVSTLTATMTPDRDGTRIEGRIGTLNGMTIFLGFWFGALILFLLIAGSVMLNTATPLADAWPVIAVPLGLMAFGGMLFRAGSSTVTNDEAAILAFLADTVDARPQA